MMVNAAIKGDPSMALGGASTVAKVLTFINDSNIFLDIDSFFTIIQALLVLYLKVTNTVLMPFGSWLIYDSRSVFGFLLFYSAGRTLISSFYISAIKIRLI